MKFGRVQESERQEFEEADLRAVLEHYDSPVRGDIGMTNCPLHEDRTPSLSYDLRKGVFKCHSCDMGGNGWTLIKEKESVDFRGAREFGARLGLTSGGERTGSGEVSPSTRFGRSSGRSAVAGRAGAQSADRAYRPSWRRD